jgi:phosphoenolpyruvate carboxykinase (GTP)
MMDRIHGEAGAEESAVGLLPKAEDLDLTNLDLPGGTLEKLFEINPEEWQAEVEDMEKFYAELGEKLPGELREQLRRLKEKF